MWESSRYPDPVATKRIRKRRSSAMGRAAGMGFTVRHPARIGRVPTRLRTILQLRSVREATRYAEAIAKKSSRTK